MRVVSPLVAAEEPSTARLPFKHASVFGASKLPEYALSEIVQLHMIAEPRSRRTRPSSSMNLSAVVLHSEDVRRTPPIACNSISATYLSQAMNHNTSGRIEHGVFQSLIGFNIGPIIVLRKLASTLARLHSCGSRGAVVLSDDVRANNNWIPPPSRHVDSHQWKGLTRFAAAEPLAAIESVTGHCSAVQGLFLREESALQSRLLHRLLGP